MLGAEVDQLKRMLKAGAGWEVVSQMMSYISDKAAQVSEQKGGARCAEAALAGGGEDGGLCWLMCAVRGHEERACLPAVGAALLHAFLPTP